MKRMLFCICLLAAVPAAAQPLHPDSLQWLYRNMYEQYFDGSKGLFREKMRTNPDEKPFSYLWPLCALIQTANEMETVFPAESFVDRVLTHIAPYYDDQTPPVPGYSSYIVGAQRDSRFYDDNQWIGIAVLDAWERTKKPRYLDKAKEIYRYMMSGYGTAGGGGLYWKEGDGSTKNTCSNAPGAILALGLYLATKEKAYLDTGLLLYNWTKRTLQAPDALYFDALRLPTLEIDQRKYSYNTGTMMQSALLLHRITGKRRYLKESKRMAVAASGYFFKNGMMPENHWFNAVLLRAYEELYKMDGNRTYLNQFKIYAGNAWARERDSRGLVGVHENKILLDQAGYLEILLRLYRNGLR